LLLSLRKKVKYFEIFVKDKDTVKVYLLQIYIGSSPLISELRMFFRKTGRTSAVNTLLCKKKNIFWRNIKKKLSKRLGWRWFSRIKGGEITSPKWQEFPFLSRNETEEFQTPFQTHPSFGEC
jgi:hypothetical protein